VIHPFFTVLLRRPDLIARHLGNHVDLIRAELSAAKRAMLVKAAGAVVAGVCLLLALGLTAVAIMLGVLQGFHWALVVVPGVAWLLFVIGLVAAVRAAVVPKAQEVQQQFEADLDLLRVVRKEKLDERL